MQGEVGLVLSRPSALVGLELISFFASFVADLCKGVPLPCGTLKLTLLGGKGRTLFKGDIIYFSP